MESNNKITPQSQDATMLLNGFEIKLSLCSGVLTIEAEEQGPNSRFFATDIDDAQVKTLTDSIFEDSFSLQEGLQEALTITDPTIQVKFSDEGKILYSWETQRGSKKKCFEFAIPLKEVQLDPLKTLERRTEKLQKKVEEQEALILRLRGENDKLKFDSFPTLEMKVEKLQKKVEEQEGINARLMDENTKLKSDIDKNILDKVEDLKKKILPKLLEENNHQFDKKFEANIQEKLRKFEQVVKDTLTSVERRYNLYEIENRIDQKMKEMSLQIPPPRFVFNIAAKNASCFTFSRRNGSVTFNHNSGFKAIFAEKPLPKTPVSFSVRIDQTSHKRIMIGIIPANLLQSDTCYNSSGAYMYYACNGQVYMNRTNNAALTACSTGSTVTVTVNLPTNKIEWTLSDGKSWSTTLDSSFTNSHDYYPCIELYDQNDKVSFV